MLDQLFATRFGLASETRILEMCNWDEDRAADVMDLLTEALQSSVDVGDYSTPDLIIENVSNTLSESLDDHEVEVLMDIIRESMENFNFLISTDSEYEN
jgi:hypothetical protein